MFNVGAGEMVFILVAALLVLGPGRLPEMARAMGKFMREFRRQTDDVRVMVEREFYRMDEDALRAPPTAGGPAPLAQPEAAAAPTLVPVPQAVARGGVSEPLPGEVPSHAAPPAPAGPLPAGAAAPVREGGGGTA